MKTTLKDRIKEIRKSNRMNQAEFGAKIGVKGNTIGNYELGLRNPSDAVIFSICREFRINETWLRTGKGKKEINLPPEDEAAAAISNVLEDICYENSIYTLVKEFLLKYDKLDSKSKDVINKLADDVVHGYIEKREDT